MLDSDVEPCLQFLNLGKRTQIRKSGDILLIISIIYALQKKLNCTQTEKAYTISLLKYKKVLVLT